MINPSRNALLATITELSRRYPDWRLGQLIANVAGWVDQDIWDVEDEQLLAAALAHLRQLAPMELDSSNNAELWRQVPGEVPAS